MARIRSIKPEFFTSGQLVECSTNARLLFVGTWVFADDCGRHKLNFKTLKMEVFPGDELTADDVRGMFEELWAAGLVTVYEHDAQRYFFINGWHHQKIDRPQPPRCPDPDGCRIVPFDERSTNTRDDSTNVRRSFATDTIRYDRRGSDQKGEDTDTVAASGGVCVSEATEDAPKRTRKPAKPLEGFDEWWALYPRKQAKPTAQDAYAKARTKIGRDELHDLTRQYAAAVLGWLPLDKIPHPSTWLNQERWTDDPETWTRPPPNRSTYDDDPRGTFAAGEQWLAMRRAQREQEGVIDGE